MDFLKILLASAAGSAIVSSIFGYFLSRRLEKFKADISLKKEIEKTRAQKRLEIYDAVAELGYRIRKIVREITSSLKLDSFLIDELKRSNQELSKRILEKNVRILEEDGVFKEIHSYKNEVSTYISLIDDLEFYENHDRQSERQSVKDKIIEQSQKIDSDYSDLLKKLRTAEKPAV